MIVTETERLRLRNWEYRDRDLFVEINSDPEVMTFFSYRRTRAEADALFDRNRQTIADTGFGFYALALKETDEALGFCGLAMVDLSPILPSGTIEIGWRMARRHWAKGYVTEAARALLAVGFETRGLSEIVSFAVPGNHRSIAVMERIGLVRDADADFDHPRVPATHPQLRRHVLYRGTRPV
ncbi:GNAT family acetyltransferase [Rhizobium sp. Leaf371]|uniref:GNAT family N-acetyltransferase n=1 Tax=Rhizobium sp. Leaf371 TaxID=1736355 RepID=UPI000712A989|nr:GNAT family N-acetyltransferase [Rhizobium sp. Leaf371]KQS72678.1 GNAT family acetyltransferase [Rhizobium sp. Leaf371]